MAVTLTFDVSTVDVFKMLFTGLVSNTIDLTNEIKVFEAWLNKKKYIIYEWKSIAFLLTTIKIIRIIQKITK